MRQRSRPRRRGGVVLLALLVAALLAGCSSIPVTGPVGTLQPRVSSQDDETSPIEAVGPSDGDDPASIVSGFIAAGADSSDDYAVARSFLTPERAQSWDATAGTSVVDQGVDVVSTVGENSLRASLNVVRRIDADGLRTDLSPASTVRITFTVKRVDGEWRISRAPDGIIVDASRFELLFTPVTLYYYADETFSTLVPDLRWFARRKGRVTTVVSSLLAGPAPYLQGVVTSAFPEEAKLRRSSVPVEDGTATVDLPGTVVSGVSDQERQRMVQQLTLSLSDIGTVSEVHLSTDGRDLDVGAQGAPLPEPILQPAVDDTLVGVREGRLVTGPAENLTEVSSPGEAVTAPALAPTGDGVVALTHQGSRLVSLQGDGSLKTLLRGGELLDPSFGPRSWVMTAERGSDGPLQAVRAGGGGRITLSAGWLRGLRLSSVRVSVDGTRLAMTATQDDREVLLVTGIRRDEAGKPVGLTPPLRLRNPNRATRVLWADQDTLVAYRESATELASIEEIGLDGHVEAWRQKLRGISRLTLAAGRDGDVDAQTADGLYLRRVTGWQGSPLTVRELAFRG